MTCDNASTFSWNYYIENDGNSSTMTQNNRKRSREDDACEFMPLSKRINNLHINNNLVSGSVSQSQDSSQIIGIITENGIPSPSSSSDSERRPSYDPGIHASQSNYYYDNKLLFELHLERIERSGQQFPY